jgi:uncharacterized membrane protein
VDDFTLARVVHVVAVLFWIGGVGFVTLVLLPWVRNRYAPADRLAAFHAVEGRFAPQARLWVALAGLSGLWMAYRADLWRRFGEISFWWMHAMVLVWLLFALMLFVIEPLALHRRMQTSTTPARDFDRLVVGHRVLLALSVIALVGAVGGSHGLF